MRLTDISLKALAAPERGQKTYFDDSVPGFGCRVSQGGTKTFVLVNGGARERTTLGRYGIISLADARVQAKRLLAERTLGEFRPRGVKFNQVSAQFLAIHYRDKKPRTRQDAHRLVHKYYLPRFRNDLIEDISTDRITRMLDRLSPSEANHCFEVGRTFFRWCVKRRYLKHSPLEGLPLPTRKIARDRVLSDDELKTIWHASSDYPFGAIVRLLILTGQRRTEIATLRWEFINIAERTITLPDTKNNRPHRFPYGDRVSEILEAIPTKQGFLFPSPRFGDRPFNNWSHTTDKLNLQNWTLHDIRRTFATNLAALGVQLPTIEKLLNHVSGSFSGIVLVYQRYDWMPEMRAAVSKWEARLTSLLNA